MQVRKSIRDEELKKLEEKIKKGLASSSTRLFSDD